VLLVDDDAERAEAVRAGLEGAGFCDNFMSHAERVANGV
jgi:DNA-binding response OmpR family regulator